MPTAARGHREQVSVVCGECPSREGSGSAVGVAPGDAHGAGAAWAALVGLDGSEGFSSLASSGIPWL